MCNPQWSYGMAVTHSLEGMAPHLALCVLVTSLLMQPSIAFHSIRMVLHMCGVLVVGSLNTCTTFGYQLEGNFEEIGLNMPDVFQRKAEQWQQ